jgi:hypothetical protein
MIFYRTKWGFKVAELWYDLAEKSDRKVDVLRCRFVPSVLKNSFSVFLHAVHRLAEKSLWALKRFLPL